MKSTDSEPQEGGMELEQYRTSLEQMVEEKSKDLIAIQENLEATNRRQALLYWCRPFGDMGKPPRRSYVWLHQRMVQRRYRTRYRLLAEYDH